MRLLIFLFISNFCFAESIEINGWHYDYSNENGIEKIELVASPIMILSSPEIFGKWGQSNSSGFDTNDALFGTIDAPCRNCYELSNGLQRVFYPKTVNKRQILRQPAADQNRGGINASFEYFFRLLTRCWRKRNGLLDRSIIYISKFCR